MTIWLERKDKITRFDDFVQWRLDGRPPPPNEIPPNIHRTRIQIARNPTASMTFDDVCDGYGARDFSEALSKFLVHHMNPLMSQAELADEVSHFNPGFGRIPVFQKVKIWIKDLQGRAEADDTLDVIHARRESKAKSGRKLSARFDTALVNTASSDGLSEPDFRVAQVRIIFKLPKLSDPRLQSLQSRHLAYVQWFSHLRAHPEPHHGLYKVMQDPQSERRCGEVIEVSRISQSVQLFPCFNGSWRVSWNTDNVLEKCDTFFVNSLQNRHTYLVLS